MLLPHLPLGCTTHYYADWWPASLPLSTVTELDAGFPKQKDFHNGKCSCAPGWQACAGDPEKCSNSQTGLMNQYIKDFDDIMQGTQTYKSTGNGAFIHSCHTHCEGQKDHSWNGFKINGVSMQEAMGAWWNSDGKDPSAKHSHTPCQYKMSTPRMCNPTCA